jgi:hypothetical protein
MDWNRFRRQRLASSLPVIGRSLVWVMAAALCLPSVVSPSTGETRLFRLNSSVGFLKGTLDGIGVDELGTLRLADRVERLAEVDEPFLLSAASHPEGWVIGTGNAGRVLLVTFAGEVQTLFTAAEPEIFSVWAADDGTVFAGSSPDGKVYRIAEGEASVFFDPGETYIWDLAVAVDGSLLVATGTEGKLYKVGTDGEGEVFFDSEDTHLRAMKVLETGEILLGTAGEGLILKLSPTGQAQTLYDAPHPEVVAFAAEPGGNCFAALLASEASLINLSQPRQAGDDEAEGGDQGEESGQETQPQVEVVVVNADEAQTSPVGSRPPGFAGARSEVLRISPSGAVETLTTFQEETVYALRWHRGRLWIGTGLEGKVFSLKDRRPVLEKDVDERQVVALLADSPGPAFATTNAAALYRIADQAERSGSYTSPALDAEQISRFGTLRWQGDAARGTRIEFSFRSGMSSDPDGTWSAWTEPRTGEEIPLSDLPAGRFVQWRASFSAADGQSPHLSEATVSYRQANLPPRVKSLSLLDPGQILVPANFNPAQQAYEPAHPNRQGIFTTVQPVAMDPQKRWKTLWKKGYRTLRWEAEDPNEDQLVYTLSFRPDGTDRSWLEMVEDLSQDHYSFDSTVLPDGRYRFRLQAADRLRADDAERQEAEEISEPVLVDHSTPSLVSVGESERGLQIVVEDRWNPLREAVYSVDAQEWRPALPLDGLLDGQRETLILPATEPGSLVLLRVTDAAFNVVTIDLTGGESP